MVTDDDGWLSSHCWMLVSLVLVRVGSPVLVLIGASSVEVSEVQGSSGEVVQCTGLQI